MRALRALERRSRATFVAALTEIRLRPLHTAIAALVLGLLAGPRAPLAVLAGLAAGPFVTRRPAAALLVAVALGGGALLADARLAALDATALADRLGHAASVRVWLLEAPRPRAFGGRTAVARLGRERVLVRTTARVPWPAARIGREIAVDGVLEGLRPGDAWLRPRNVHAVLRADRLVPTGRARGGLPGALDRVRERAESALDRGLPPPQAALMRGMLLGEDEALSQRMRDDFQTSGLSHLVR
jgi:competence protein ComEC